MLNVLDEGHLLFVTDQLAFGLEPFPADLDEAVSSTQISRELPPRTPVGTPLLEILRTQGLDNDRAERKRALAKAWDHHSSSFNDQWCLHQWMYKHGSDDDGVRRALSSSHPNKEISVNHCNEIEKFLALPRVYLEITSVRIICPSSEEWIYSSMKIQEQQVFHACTCRNSWLATQVLKWKQFMMAMAPEQRMKSAKLHSCVGWSLKSWNIGELPARSTLRMQGMLFEHLTHVLHVHWARSTQNQLLFLFLLCVNAYTG